LVRLRAFLVGAGFWNAESEQQLLEECARQVDAAVAEYLSTARPATDAMFDHLFATPPRHIREQRETARAYANQPGGH
jgi:pyruvate dehydrogenase E1 component alpha subunit